MQMVEYPPVTTPTIIGSAKLRIESMPKMTEKINTTVMERNVTSVVLTDRANDDSIFTCETCGRLLYWDPRRDAPVGWKPGQVAGSQK